MIRSTAIGSALILLTACTDERAPMPLPADVVTVMPVAETVPVAGAADAADDPAIWVNPQDPSKSLVIGTDKKNGLAVYDLDGQIVYQNTDGRMNNVDVRGGYPITTNNGDPATAKPTVIVAATNRTSKEIVVYAMNPESGVLTDIMAEPIPSNFDEPYGLCLYRSAVNGKLYVYANDIEGRVSQWQLYDNGLGKLRATIQRTWPVGSQTEGCVADDVNGWVFIGEEATGIWRYGAEPKDSFDERVIVDTTGLGGRGGGHLSADVEGLSLYIPDSADSAQDDSADSAQDDSADSAQDDSADSAQDDSADPAQDNSADPAPTKNQGYLIASSQGNYSYVVYDRAPPHAYRGTFQVIDNAEKGVDGAQQTDGLAVVSANLGPNYPAGLLVTQDGYNKSPDGAAENQNFKYISWADVAEALGLE